MEIKIDRNLYADSLKAALKVDFLKSSKELKLYAASIYNASMWAREIDKKLAIRTRINAPWHLSSGINLLFSYLL